MTKQDILMDRTFDAACLRVKGDTEWSNQIILRLKSNHPESVEQINKMVEFYTNMVSNNADFLSRADYMIEHKGKMRLRF